MTPVPTKPRNSLLTGRFHCSNKEKPSPHAMATPRAMVMRECSFAKETCSSIMSTSLKVPTPSSTTIANSYTCDLLVSKTAVPSCRGFDAALTRSVTAVGWSGRAEWLGRRSAALFTLDRERHPRYFPIVEREHGEVVVSGSVDLEVGDLVFQSFEMGPGGEVDLARHALIEDRSARTLDAPLLGERSVIVTPASQHEKSRGAVVRRARHHFVHQARVDPAPLRIEQVLIEYLRVVQACAHALLSVTRQSLLTFWNSPRGPPPVIGLDRHALVDELLVPEVPPRRLHRRDNAGGGELGVRQRRSSRGQQPGRRAVEVAAHQRHVPPLRFAPC